MRGWPVHHITSLLSTQLKQVPFIHLDREEQVGIKCLAQGLNTQAHTGFELMTLGSWVLNSTAELYTCLYRRVKRWNKDQRSPLNVTSFFEVEGGQKNRTKQNKTKLQNVTSFFGVQGGQKNRTKQNKKQLQNVISFFLVEGGQENRKKQIPFRNIKQTPSYLPLILRFWFFNITFQIYREW